MPQPGSQPGTQVLTPQEAAAGGFTMGPAGFYLDAQGNLAPGQITPGQRDNPSSTLLYDSSKDLYYTTSTGTPSGPNKKYLSPMSFAGSREAFQALQTRGLPNAPKGTGFGKPQAQGGGLVHGNPTWNPDKGSWDVGIDWGKVLSYAVAAGLGAGVISAIHIAAAGGAVSSEAAQAATASGAAGTAASTATGATAAGLGPTTAATTAATAAGLTPPTALAAGTGTAAATAAAAAPAIAAPATAAATSSVGNWLSKFLPPILQTAIPVIGNVVGANIQSTGIKEAAEIQAKSTAEALAFEKQQYGDLVGRLTPYIASGTTSTDRMSQLLGLPARPSTTAAPWPGPSGPPGSPSPTGRTMTPEPVPGGRTMLPTSTTEPVGPSAQTIMMRAPDGTTKAVPMSEVDHWKSKGAQVLQ